MGHLKPNFLRQGLRAHVPLLNTTPTVTNGCNCAAAVINPTIYSPSLQAVRRDSHRYGHIALSILRLTAQRIF